MAQAGCYNRLLLRLLAVALSHAAATSHFVDINNVRTFNNGYSLKEVELQSAHPNCAITYNVLSFSVGLPGSISVYATSLSGDEAQPTNNVAELSTYGLVELKCGACVWASKPLAKRAAHFIPDGLVPTPHIAEHATTAFLASATVPGFVHTLSSFGSKVFGGLVVVNASVSPACLERVDGAPGPSREAQEEAMQWFQQASPCSPRREDACSLRFLSPVDQKARTRPGVLTLKLGADGIVHVLGDLALQRQQTIGKPTLDGEDDSKTGARMLETLRLGRSVLRSAFPAMYSTESSSPTSVNSKPPKDDVLASLLELVQRVETGENSNDLPSSRKMGAASAFVEVDAELSSKSMEAAALGSIPGLDKMLGPILDGLLKPIVGLVAGTLGDVLGDSIGKLMASTVDSGLTSEITSVLGHSLPPALTESLVPPLTQSLLDSIPNALGPMLRDAVSTAVADKLTKLLSESLSETLAETISAQLEEEVPDQLSQQLSPELTYLLTQSVTQAVVPALTYTLHHSPAEDHFCAYCKAFSIYCEYCRKNGPNQLYHAQYYAAYYSKYYASMYSKTDTVEDE